MGASESSLLQRSGDEITVVSERSESIDPVLERLRSLQIANPILESLPAERSLTDILVRKPLLSSNSSGVSVAEANYLDMYAVPKDSLLNLEYLMFTWFLQKHGTTHNAFDPRRSSIGTVDPQVLLELFSMYRDWQEKKTQNISKRQEEIENKIDVADALAVKLLQRFNYSVSAMRTSSNHLSEVHSLQVELGELKGRLTEVISNCDGLCKRIAANGPESLKSTVKPFVLASSDPSTSSADTARLKAETVRTEPQPMPKPT